MQFIFFFSQDVKALTPLTPEVISRQATINIGTIGHVAHGKSTVVKAISGVQVCLMYMYCMYFRNFDQVFCGRSVRYLTNVTDKFHEIIIHFLHLFHAHASRVKYMYMYNYI